MTADAGQSPPPRRAPALSREERATGRAYGVDHAISPGLPPTAASPREALSGAIADGLQRPPCLVSFSGGWDSSIVLALATRVARERGLPEPVPVTLRFPGVAAAEESHWQEMVVEHLGLTEWERVELHHELDVLGDISRQALLDHGLLWPPNAHFHVPIIVRARSGTLLTGMDGDGLLGGWRWHRAQAVLHGQRRPRPRDALSVALALAPERLRRRRLAGGVLPVLGWLRPEERAAMSLALVDEWGAGEPRRWDRRVAWYARRRYLSVAVRAFELLAEPHGVVVRHPLIDRRHLSALAADGGAAGYGDRYEAMRRLFADLLPRALLERRTKALFPGAFWGPQARAFARQWDGSGVDTELVDAEALRATWMVPDPPLFAATLMQDAWLTAQEKWSSKASATRGS